VDGLALRAAEGGYSLHVGQDYSCAYSMSYISGYLGAHYLLGASPNPANVEIDKIDKSEKGDYGIHVCNV